MDVVDFGLGDAGGSSAEAVDDLVGEAVGDLAGGVFGGFLAVLLGEYLWVLEVLGVEEVAVGDKLAANLSEGAEGEHAGAGGRVGVALQLNLGGRAGRAGRHEALGDDVEDACCGEVGVEGGIEGLLEGQGLCVGGERLEVGDGDADGGDSRTGSGEDVVLGACGRGEQSGQHQQQDGDGVSGWGGLCAGCAGRAIHALYGRRSGWNFGCNRRAENILSEGGVGVDSNEIRGFFAALRMTTSRGLRQNDSFKGAAPEGRLHPYGRGGGSK